MFMCINAGLSGIRSVRNWNEKTNRAGTGPVPDQAKAVRHFFCLFLYRTEIIDAGMPMPTVIRPTAASDLHAVRVLTRTAATQLTSHSPSAPLAVTYSQSLNVSPYGRPASTWHLRLPSPTVKCFNRQGFPASVHSYSLPTKI